MTKLTGLFEDQSIDLCGAVLKGFQCVFLGRLRVGAAFPIDVDFRFHGTGIAGTRYIGFLFFIDFQLVEFDTIHLEWNHRCRHCSISTIRD